MAKNYSKEAKQFRDNYLREMYDVDPAKSNIKIPEEHVPPHLRQWINKVKIETEKPLTIARIISPDTSKDLLIKATMQRYGKKDGKYLNPDELKKALLQIKGA